MMKPLTRDFLNLYQMKNNTIPWGVIKDRNPAAVRDFLIWWLHDHGKLDPSESAIKKADKLLSIEPKYLDGGALSVGSWLYFINDFYFRDLVDYFASRQIYVMVTPTFESCGFHLKGFRGAVYGMVDRGGHPGLGISQMPFKLIETPDGEGMQRIPDYPTYHEAESAVIDTGFDVAEFVIKSEEAERAKEAGKVSNEIASILGGAGIDLPNEEKS